MMKKMAFISRHVPTAEQLILAEKAGYELIPVGDIDAFSGELPVGYDAIAVVHPALALRAISGVYRRERQIGVFENGNRAPEGAPPQFSAVALRIYKVSVADGVIEVWHSTARLDS